MIDVIKEYLVSLGMQVDKKSFDAADKTINTLEQGVKSFAGSTIRNFALASTAVVSAMATASIGILTFLGSLAKADLETEKFARRMWLSKDAAAELSNTLKAMGATIEDLYLSPELMRNFQQLRSTINEMKPPPEFQNQMKFIRSIQFEFQRLRLEATYGLQWIGYYLFKYLEGPLVRVKTTLQAMNKNVIQNMPNWSKNIAQVLSWVGRLGATFIHAGADVLRLVSELGDRIPRTIKIIGASLLGLAVLLKTGPLGIIFALLTSLLLLLDDFYTFLEGGESALGPLWKKLQDFYKLLKDTGAIDRLGKAFDNVFRTIEDWLKRAWGWLQQLYNKLQERGYLDTLESAWSSTFGLLFKIVQGLWGWVTAFFDELNDEGILSGLIDSVIDLGKEINETIGWVADLVSKFLELEEVQSVLEGIGNFVSGTLKFALELVKNTIDGITNSIKIARAWLSGDDEGLQQALKEQDALRKREAEFGQRYGGKIKDFFNFMFVDENAPNPFLSGTAESSKQADKINTSVTNLPKGMEPSFKKALNESELVKGFRSFNQDLNKGFNLLAMMINPEALRQYHDMSMGGLPSSYMYTASTTSNQTIIRTENKPTFYITSTDPKAAAQEVGQIWTGMNIRSMRPAFG
ncbi:hypothetical protein FOI68_20665 [Brevibacillus sp. LEMMJ03]|uniref:phage tail protein n=1 Tax=Brevibacillus sp. LEMMJ03 TaxID=2595056 RepID=UPI00117E1CEB|nr:hypothetical protein [Brevibacillus sp. LEMMJ03]TRY23680.1 hypothetical protein FOI68_20665 [Brevibacillus sp. LEMMJ03]